MSTKLSLFLTALIVGGLGIFTAMVYPNLAENVPVHWGLTGKIDGWLPRATAVWTFFGVIAGIVVLLQVLPLVSPRKFSISEFLPTYNVVRVILVGLLGHAHVISMLSATNPAFDSGRALFGGLLLFLAVLGNYLGKVRKNFFVGIRVPWTLASDKNWIATHRLAARLLVVVGIIGAPAVFLGAPVELALLGLIVAIIVPVFYSLWLFRSGKDREIGTTVAVLSLLMLSMHAQAAEREVTFKGVGGFDLVGTYSVPDAAVKGKTRALLLIPGSGPTDRDANQRPQVITDLLKTIAAHLEKDGIATLRFDKRAVVKSYASKWPKGMDALGEFFTFENFVGDAEAALDFLRAQPEVDVAKTGVLGHSEGSTIALKMTTGKNPPPFLVLMACAGRPIGDVFHNQMDMGMVRTKTPDAQRLELLKGLRTSLDEFKSTGKIPATVPDPFKMFFPAYLTKYLHSFFFLDPAAIANAYKKPVLVMQGEKDIQILASKDAPILRKAFAGNEGFLYKEFPSLSHNFKVVKDENKEDGFGGPVPSDVLSTIVDWMKKR